MADIFEARPETKLLTSIPEAKMTLRKVKNVRQRAAWHQREREGAARPVARWLLWVEALAAHEEIRDEPRGWGHRPNAPDSPVRS